LHGLEGQRIMGLAVKALAASALMSAGLWVWLSVSANIPAWQVALGGILMGGIIYGLLIIILRVDEINSAWNFIRNKLHL
jgi:formate/nitrite transporter FocA (FNT family)